MTIQQPLPPWLAFPELPAESSGWRQGNAEHWWNIYWWPYWKQLNYEQQQEIVNNTTTPKDWQEKLKYFMETAFIIDEEFKKI